MLDAKLSLFLLSKDCPADTPSFRAQQCSSYNNLTHNNTADGKMYDWKPTEEGSLSVCIPGILVHQL